MAVDTTLKKPTNAIVVKGDPLVTELRVENATNMYPGRLVKKGTTDADIVVNTDMNPPLGWLGYEQAVGQNQGTAITVDTAFAALDHAPVLNGGNFMIVASLKATEVCTAGQNATPGASGEVTTWASGDTVVGIFMESKSYSASSQDVIVKSLI